MLFFVKTLMHIDRVKELSEMERVDKEINRSNIGSSSFGRGRRYSAIII